MVQLSNAALEDMYPKGLSKKQLDAIKRKKGYKEKKGRWVKCDSGPRLFRLICNDSKQAK
jgi:hypothetical protein